MSVKLRFECGQEGRFSKEYGPYDFIQLRYSCLAVGPHGDDLAYFLNDEWRLKEGDDTNWYSDVMIWDHRE